MNCRYCRTPLEHVFLDIGFAPPSNAYLCVDDLRKPEKYYPLRVMVCHNCWLVQTEDYADAEELFSANYAYFSSTSSTWVAHACSYAKMISHRLSLGTESLVIEIASNDGYLLKNFLEAGIPCLGIEPTASTASVAEALGIPVIRQFFGECLAQELADSGRYADLLVGNNVFAHVPDINDFTKGLKVALKPNGTITLEFPHLMRLIEFAQFDTVYHEHFSYLSLTAVVRIFQEAELRIFDVEELPTHGGSLRIYACHENDSREQSNSVLNLLVEEERRGLLSLDIYQEFQARAEKIKNDFLSFLLEQKKSGKRVAAYGAAAKGNTLLNFAGIKPDLLPFVVDAALAKQGQFLPGSHIPILAPEILQTSPLDFLVIFPWNIAEEVMEQNVFLRLHGTKFVIAVPELRVQ